MERELDDIRAEAEELVSRYAERDQMYEDLRRMFHMEWREVPLGDWIKPTLSPAAYNAVIGATRLMLSSDPQVSVPYDQTEADQRTSAERIERWCKGVWAASGRLSQRPVHFDALFSAVLFGAVCGSVSRTSDLLTAAQASSDRSLLNRLRYAASITPYVFQVYNPATCYPDLDVFGLRAMLRRYKCSWGEALAAFGSALEEADPSGATRRRTDEIEVNDWYDWSHRAVWIEGQDKPIIFEEHGLPFLPVVAQLTDGSAIFTRPEEACTPLLYPVLKSGLWKRDNLSLTTIFSLIFALGSNPLLVRRTGQPGKPLIVDRSVPGGVIDLEQDEQLTPLAEKVIDQSLMTGVNLVSTLMQESTISKHTLGLPPAFQMPYSAISLLSQSGRLPLVGPMVLGGNAIASMMIAALHWARRPDSDVARVIYQGQVLRLDPAEIPESPIVQVTLEPDVPQDKLQMANTAVALRQSDLASRRWVREKILQIGQSAQMDKEIWMDRRLEAEMALRLAQLQAQSQQAPQAPQGGGEPGSGNGAYPPGGVMPGQPLAGPLPPQTAPQAE